MVDTALIETILSYSIGGVSLGFIVYLVIYVMAYFRKMKKENGLTEKTIIDCFKQVVIPKDIRINLSKTMKPIIKKEIEDNIKPILKSYNKLLLQNYLMLSILSKFTHAEDLTEEEQTLLAELLNDGSILEIDISEGE